MKKRVFLKFLCMTMLLAGAAVLFSCKPERGAVIDGYIEEFLLGRDKETHGYMWDLSTFPFYRMENDEWWDVFERSSVTILNDGQALLSHLRRFMDWGDTALAVYDSAWPGWEALPEEVDFEGKSVIAVSLKETWDVPLYSAYMRGEEDSYDLFLVSYRYPGVMIPAIADYKTVRSGVAAFRIPWIPTDAEVRLHFKMVEDEDAAEAAMSEWLSTGI